MPFWSVPDYILCNGYRFDQEGLKPTPEKVQAIYECEPPRSKTEVRSFLGMTGYLSKFIPRYASLTKPLRDLTRTETKFHWGPTEDKAFKEVKGAITSKDTIAFFNPKLPIMVPVEASYNEGLSAGLFQQSAKGWQPVHFISRSLTDVEKKVQSDRKGCVVCEMGQRSVRYVPSGCSKIYNRDSTQATIAYVQQTISKASSLH